MRSISSRLATLYTSLLAVTLLLVVLASSVALLGTLAGFTHDIVYAKHEEARRLASLYQQQGLTLTQAAPSLARRLAVPGLQVAVFDAQGRFLAGDHISTPPFHVVTRPGQTGRQLEGPPFAAIDGGYVFFVPSSALLVQSLVPYWRVMALIIVFALLLSWIIGRVVERAALRPLDEVTASLQAVAQGDFRPRRFILAGGDEIGSLTAAFNDAIAGVDAAMSERARVQERMQRFVADAGHELRTPLTILGGYIDVLRRGAVDEPKIARQILSTMTLERERMRALIDRLVRLARVDESVAPRTESIDVAELLRSQCEAAQRLDDSCEIDYALEGDVKILGDRIELGEALWNLVENALKHAPESPIHLHAQRDGEQTIISVRDEGPGMSETERLHAFERFYRGDVHADATGSGLGLAIAKAAVERAGGTISLDTAPGHGTTVTIRL